MHNANKGTQVVMIDRQEEERINNLIDKYTQSEQENPDVKEKGTQMDQPISKHEKDVSNANADLSIQIADLRNEILSIKQRLFQHNQPSTQKKQSLKWKTKTKKCKRKIRKNIKRRSRCQNSSARSTWTFDETFMDDLYQKYILSRKVKERKISMSESCMFPQSVMGDFTVPYKRIGLLDNDILGIKNAPKQTQLNKMDVWPSEVNVNPPRSLDQYFRNSSQHEAESSEQASRSMNLEMLRLETFKNFPQTSSARPIRLARSGFFFTGNEDRVECYSCGIIYRNWRNDEDPSEVHRRISPMCQHVQNQDRNNVPIHAGSTTSPAQTSHAEQSTMPSESNSHISTANANPQISSSSGMSNTNVNDLPVSSSDIQGERQGNSQNTVNGNSTISTSTMHSTVSAAMGASSSPVSHFALNHAQNQNNGTITTSSNHNEQTSQRSNDSGQTSTRDAMIQKLNPLGITFDKPRYPAYAIITVRISSFQNWPPRKTQTPRALAYAGFLYAGHADYVRCFFCGGGLRNWEDGDDPWVEHARWFPRCAFLRQNKGDEFVTLVQEQHLKEQNQSTEGRGNVSCNEDNGMGGGVGRIRTAQESVMNSDAVRSVMEMGYTEKQVSDVLEKRNWNINGKPSLTAQGILDILLDEESSAERNTEANAGEKSESLTDPTYETRSLMEENLRLKDQRLCKVCLDKEANIAMLPCGHLCCCPECAPAMRKCPICRAFVKGTVRTWLA